MASSSNLTELAYANSFTRFVFLRQDYHLDKIILPHDLTEYFEFVFNKLFDYGC